MSVLRWIVGTLMTLLLVIVIALASLPLWFDPASLKPALESQLSAASDRQVELNGELSLSVWPWVGAGIESMVVKQPAAIGGDFLSVESAQFRVALLPLLRGRFEVDTIVIEQPRVEIISISDEVHSLTMEPAVSSSASNDAEGDSLDRIQLSGIRIEDASVVIDDRVNGAVTRFESLSAELGNVLGDEFAPVQFRGVLKDEGSAPLSFEVTSGLRVDLPSGDLLGQAATFTLMHPDAAIEGEITQWSLVNSGTLEIAALKTDIAPTVLSEPLKVSTPSLVLDTQSGSMQSPSALIELAASRLEVNDLEGRIWDTLQLNARLNVAQHALSDTLDAIGIAFQPHDKSTLKSVAFQADLAIGSERVSVSQGSAQIDDSTIEFAGSMNYVDATDYRFTIGIDQIDLDRYLSSEEDTAEDDFTAESFSISLDGLEGLQANGTVDVGQLSIFGLPMQEARIEVITVGDRLTIKPRAALFQGSLGGEISYQNKTLRIANAVQQVNLSEFLTTAEITDQLSGTGALTLDLTASERDGVVVPQGLLPPIGQLSRLPSSRFPL